MAAVLSGPLGRRHWHTGQAEEGLRLLADALDVVDNGYVSLRSHLDFEMPAQR